MIKTTSPLQDVRKFNQDSMVKLPLRVPLDHLDWINHEAARCRITPASVVRRAVRWYMEAMDRKMVG